MEESPQVRMARLQGELDGAKYIRDGLKGAARKFAEIKIKEIEERINKHFQNMLKKAVPQ
jgi:hypothetical protein